MGQSLGGICVNHKFDTDGFDLGREIELEWKFQKKFLLKLHLKEIKRKEYIMFAFWKTEL